MGSEADCTVVITASVLPKLRDRQQLAALIRSGELEAGRYSGRALPPISLNSILRELLAPYTGDIAAKVSVRSCVELSNSGRHGFQTPALCR